MQQKNFRIIPVSLLACAVIVLASFALGKWFFSSRSIVKPVKPAVSMPTSSHPLSQTPTPDQEAVLKVPLHDASPEEKTRYAQLVAKLAEEKTQLTLDACMPDSLVYRVALNGSFKVRNNDTVVHTIRYLTTQIPLPAQSATVVKTSQLFQKAGDYGYGCDNPFAKMGVFMVR